MVTNVRTKVHKITSIQSQRKIMNSEKLKELQDELNNEMHEILKDSKFGKILEKYDMLGDRVLKFKCVLDLTKAKSHDVTIGEKTKEFLQALPEQEIVMSTRSWCIPCPFAGYPRGCNC